MDLIVQPESLKLITKFDRRVDLHGICQLGLIAQWPLPRGYEADRKVDMHDICQLGLIVK